MKNRFVILMMTLFACACLAWTITDVKPRVKYSVKGTVYISGQPAAGMKMYVRMKDYPMWRKSAVVDSFVSDANGNFAMKLYAGTYYFLEPWKMQPLVMPADSVCDTACYVRHYKGEHLPHSIVTSRDSMGVLYLTPDATERICTYEKLHGK